MMDGMFEQMFGKNIIESFEQFFHYIPGKTVIIGDTWEKSSSMMGFGNIDNSLKLMSVSDNVASIKIDGKITIAAQTPDSSNPDTENPITQLPLGRGLFLYNIYKKCD